MLVAALALHGCANPATGEQTAPEFGGHALAENATGIPTPGKEAQQPENGLQAFLLTADEMPESGFVRQRMEAMEAPRGSAKQNGWKEGVKATFLKAETNNAVDVTQVGHTVTRYPPENLDAVLDDVHAVKKRTMQALESQESGITVEEQPDPGIGEKSAAYWTDTDGLQVIEVFFYRRDVFQERSWVQTQADYAALLELAKKADAKIDQPHVSHAESRL